MHDDRLSAAVHQLFYQLIDNGMLVRENIVRCIDQLVAAQTEPHQEHNIESFASKELKMHCFDALLFKILAHSSQISDVVQ